MSTMSHPAGPIDTRFWPKVAKSDGCWEWTGARYPNGYGAFGIRGGVSGAHRVAWELVNGPIPDGLWVLHYCDNRCCVRPDHLWLGTNTDNVRDMHAKGRGRKTYVRGVACKMGHSLSGPNVYQHGGQRWCVTCRRDYMRRYEVTHPRRLR